jgi:hypothetical protein
VALSLGSPPPDVIRHRASMEPGLSSPGRNPKRPPGRLTCGMWGRSACGVKAPVGAPAPNEPAFAVPLTLWVWRQAPYCALAVMVLTRAQ